MKARTEYDDYKYLYAPVIHVLMDYTKFSDKSNDSLLRCTECGIKHDFHDLTRMKIGVFVCKFCLKQGV